MSVLAFKPREKEILQDEKVCFEDGTKGVNLDQLIFACMHEYPKVPLKHLRVVWDKGSLKVVLIREP
jgi:hypothetical protein